MTADATELLTAARTLPVTDRRELINALIRTLPEEPGAERAWMLECRRRLEAYDRGEATVVPLTDVFPELVSDADE